jgi:hypothetical protein
MGEIRFASGFWLENLKGRDHFGNPSVGGRIILE